MRLDVQTNPQTNPQTSVLLSGLATEVIPLPTATTS